MPKLPATRAIRAALSNTLAIRIFMASVSVWRTEREKDRPLVTGQLTGEGLLRLLIRTRSQVEMILVDIDDFHPLPFALEGERITRVHRFQIINRRLPVALVL